MLNYDPKNMDLGAAWHVCHVPQALRNAAQAYRDSAFAGFAEPDEHWAKLADLLDEAAQKMEEYNRGQEQ